MEQWGQLIPKNFPAATSQEPSLLFSAPLFPLLYSGLEGEQSRAESVDWKDCTVSSPERSSGPFEFSLLASQDQVSLVFLVLDLWECTCHPLLQ